jgi:hypothetical protein
MVHKKGYSVIEVLLAGSILALAVSGIVGSILVAQRNNQANISQNQAMSMAKEGIEALRSIRDRDYNELINDDSASLSFNNGEWVLNLNPISTDDQLTNPLRTRRIKIEKDPDLNSSNDTEGKVAKKITVTVIYQINPEGKTSTITLSETLSNIFNSKPTGVTAESQNYRLVDDNIGGMVNSFKDNTQ